MQQPHRSCSRDLPVNRPHASRATSNQPGVHRSKREQRPTGWPHHDAPHPPTTIHMNKTERHDSTITQPTSSTLTNNDEPLNDRPTNQNDLLRTPGPPEERKLDRVRRRECAPRHASPVARASSSRLTPTENQPRWGWRGQGLWPGSGPLAPRIRRLMTMCDGTLPHVSSA